MTRIMDKYYATSRNSSRSHDTYTKYVNNPSFYCTMALTKGSYDDYLAARQELLEERELSVTADSESPSRASLIKRTHNYFKPQWISYMLIAVLLIIFAGACILFGSVIYVFKEDASCPVTKNSNPYQIELWQDNRKLNHQSRALQSHFRPKRILRDLRFLAQGIHVAGTRDNTFVMRWLAEQYRSMGMQVRIFNYTVLLNYPDYSKPNSIEVQEEYTGTWRLLSDGMSRTVGDESTKHQQSDSRGLVWWSAYSADAIVNGRIVYANYGLREDFDKLEERGISLDGCIVLIRFGSISRSEKVREAERRGAHGVILFSDPIHYTTVDKNMTFPHDVWLPGSGAQRGTLLSTVGDPETPGLPSKQYTMRAENEESLKDKRIIPRIPVVPIGYDDALRLMHSLNGMAVQETSWRGGLDTVYRYTGSRTFRLSVRSKSVRRVITNVMATLKGEEEPDRWVLVGNHADAWTYGAVDPLTGTATQLEMARAFAKMAAPKRSIVFCHWDAEEFGLIGSTEFVEEMSSVLGSRAIAYINVDHISGNVSLDVKGVPMLYRLIVEASSRVPQPNPSESSSGRNTLASSWKHYRSTAGPIRGDKSIPDIGIPTIGSDYQRFISFLGISSADIRMDSHSQSYSLYHTMYEIPKLIDLIDPEGKSMNAIGQLWAEVAHRLANNLIIPLNVLDYANALVTNLAKTRTFMEQSDVWKNHSKRLNIATDHLEDAISRFLHIARTIDVIISDVTLGIRGLPMIKIEQLNSRLLQLERVFLDSHFHSSSLHRHVLYSPSNSNNPAIGTFVMITDKIITWNATDRPEEQKRVLKDILLSFTRLQYAIESAIHVLDLNTHGF